MRFKRTVKNNPQKSFRLFSTHCFPLPI